MSLPCSILRGLALYKPTCAGVCKQCGRAFLFSTGYETQSKYAVAMTVVHSW